MDWTSKLLGGLLIAALIYIIFMEKGCGSDSENVINQDTLVTIQYDTTYFDTTRFVEIEVPKTIYVYDTTFTEIINNDTINIDAKVYQDTVRDDSVSINYRALIKGELLDLQLSYKLTFPIVNQIETKVITKTVQRPLRSLYLGFDIDVTNFNYFTPNATLNLDNGWGFNGGYDLKNRALIFGVKRRLF